jgi:MFS family permease
MVAEEMPVALSSHRAVQWFRQRELTQYPQGWTQVWLLALVVIANVVHSYEAELAPVAPLLVPYLKLTLVQYGLIVALTTMVSGLAAMAAGSRFDRYGRAIFVVASTVVTAVAVFAMTLVYNALSFILVRLLMAVVLGLAVPATTGLVRDFTPRVGRALGFGIWTFGPVGANFLASWVAGWSLPLFHDDWRSQFILMGAFCLVVSIIVARYIRDLSPGLRAEVVHDRAEAAEASRRAAGRGADIAPPRLVYRSFRVWALAVGITFFLLIYYFSTAYGPLYLTQVFHYPPAVAARVASTFWIANLGVLVLVGYVSDRIGLRKILSLLGVVGLLIFMAFWIRLIGRPVPPATMEWYTSLLGVLLAIGYGPWMALYSENLEEIHPTLVGTGWALWACVQYVLAGAAGAVTFLVVGRWGYQAWFDICWAGIALYGALLAFGKGPWLRRPRPLSERSSAVSPVDA